MARRGSGEGGIFQREPFPSSTAATQRPSLTRRGELEKEPATATDHGAPEKPEN
jgi:hypothetical protein